jgi:hypothetical protein
MRKNPISARSWMKGKPVFLLRIVMDSVIRVSAASTALILAVLPAAGQQTVTMKQVFSVESQVVIQPSLSPDGRWVVYVSEDGTEHGRRLWMAQAAGGAPWPLTTEGHTDQMPSWFPGGDRILFLSTRSDRSGSRKQFAMVLDIEPSTGKPRGAPRQVTLEPTEGAAGSPDGRWVGYTTRNDGRLRVKLVPAGGGTARLLGEVPGTQQAGGLVFDATGRNVYFLTGAPQAIAKLWKMPSAGGPLTLVAESEDPLAILPGDPRFLIRYERSAPYIPPTSARLTTLEGKVIAQVRFPRYVVPNLNSGSAWGITGGQVRGAGEVRVVNIADGTTRTVLKGEHWPEAWMPDGSALITDRADNDGGTILVELVPLAGNERKTVILQSPLEAGGWATSVGPFYSYRLRDRKLSGWTGPTRFYSVDVRNGQSRLLSSAAEGAAIGGRGGFENDGDRWLYMETVGDRIELRSVDPATGEFRVVRSFPKSFKTLGFTGRNFGVHGNRVTWFEQQGDSAVLMVGDGQAPARAVTSFPWGPGYDLTTSSPSWSGNEIAVGFQVNGASTGITIVSIPASAGSPARRRHIPIDMKFCCDKLVWLRDDSGALAIAARNTNGSGSLIELPFRTGGAPRVLTQDLTEWEFLASPDLKQAAFSYNKTGVGSVWQVDFRALMASH